MSKKSVFSENGMFEAYNGSIVNVGKEVCFLINGRTGTSTTRTLYAKGIVAAMSDVKARITITAIEDADQHKPGDTVDVYFEKVIAVCV